MEEKKTKRLSEIDEKKECIIVKVNGHGGFRHRVMEMGFIRGEKVFVVKNAPLQDPIEYRIMNSHISLRRSEANHIEVIGIEDKFEECKYEFKGTFSEEINQTYTKESKTISVALVGNPNCGKTSFFNHATGLHEKVGNYSGVTVS
ncbi:MAG: FeoA domain-containing protein, partial [Paludibacteraceae bacterium]|nr:FeoA domain-containing protein [Paludibacteraceae bacterium]